MYGFRCVWVNTATTQLDAENRLMPELTQKTCGPVLYACGSLLEILN